MAAIHHKTWNDLLASHGIKVNLDGKSRCKDKIWNKSLCRTIKQELNYLNPANTVNEFRNRINHFIMFYNSKRHHQSIDKLQPCMRYGIKT